MGPMVFSKSGVMSNMCNSPFTLAVNTLGRRYVCEPSQIRNGVFNSGLMMMEQPDGYVFILFDTNNLEAAIRDSVEHPKPPAPGIFGLPLSPSLWRKQNGISSPCWCPRLIRCSGQIP